MGTHPIFESDFDCLTEMLSRTTRIISRNKFCGRSRFGFLNYLDQKYENDKRMKHLIKSGFLHKNPFDDLAPGTEVDLVQKLLLQGLVNGFENENSDITVMFCPRSPDLKYQTRELWKILSQNDKIFYGKEIFEDCEIFVENFVARDGQMYFMAFIWSKVSKLPERYQHIKVSWMIKIWKVRTMIEMGDYGYQYHFALVFKYDEKTEKWQLQNTPDWPIDGDLENL